MAQEQAVRAEPVVLDEATAELFWRYLGLTGNEALAYCSGESCVVVADKCVGELPCKHYYYAWPEGPEGRAVLEELPGRLRRVAELEREHDVVAVRFRRGEATLSQVIEARKAFERELEALRRKVLTDTRMYCRYVACSRMMQEWLKYKDDYDECRELARLLARLVEPHLTIECDCE